MKKGLVFDISRYAIHDGPGIRTTVFFKGCPLRCWWCHNPEGQNSRPELVNRKNRCNGCGECVESCRRKAISIVTHRAFVDRKSCVLCECCSRACPSSALSVAGKYMSTEEILQEIEKDRTFYEESKGGVTFSGGEPFLQSDFLNTLLKECEDRDIRTAVDTCGFAPYEAIEKTRDKVGLFLFDVKMMDNTKHARYTGASNKQILKNLRTLAEKGSSIIVSFPVIPSVNDDEKNIERTAEFISSLPSIQQVNLLPYHRAGIEKYKSLGKPFKLEKVRPPSNQKIRLVKKKIEAFGIKVGIGGG